MKVALDNNILAWFLSDAARPPWNPNTGAALDLGPERLKIIKEKVSQGELDPLVIPMPVVAELFSVAPNAREQFLPILKDPLVFTLESFGLRSAIELAEINNTYYASGDKKAGQAGTWAKIQKDRQIYAIPKACGVDAVYTDDDGLTNVCENNGITVVHSWDLPLQPQYLLSGL